MFAASTVNFFLSVNELQLALWRGLVAFLHWMKESFLLSWKAGEDWEKTEKIDGERYRERVESSQHLSVLSS
jgi:hypothetical protein